MEIYVDSSEYSGRGKCLTWVAIIVDNGSIANFVWCRRYKGSVTIMDLLGITTMLIMYVNNSPTVYTDMKQICLEKSRLHEVRFRPRVLNNIWKTIYGLVASNNADIQYVKSRSGNPYHNLADNIARYIALEGYLMLQMMIIYSQYYMKRVNVRDIRSFVGVYLTLISQGGVVD